MYQLFFDDYPIYDPRDEELAIYAPDIHLAVGEPGEMSFTVFPDHPYVDKLTKLKGVLKLHEDGIPIFLGRITKEKRNLCKDVEIESEGMLACLNDSVVPPFNFPEDFLDNAGYQAAAEDGNVVLFFLEWLIALHNSQVSPTQQITLGEVTVTDPNNYISRSSSSYSTTMSVIQGKLVDLLGGYLVPDYSSGATVVHYYADFPLTNTQSVEYGENLINLKTEIEATDTYTAILPIGKDSLTITDLPDGDISTDLVKTGHIIYSKAAEEKYGVRITKTVEWPDVTEASHLQTKAKNVLAGEGVLPTQTISITAADLGGDDGPPRFKVGRYVRLHSVPHGYDASFPLLELEPNLFNPGKTKITLGSTLKTITGLAQQASSAARGQQDRYQLELDGQNLRITEMAQTLNSQITEAIQTSESIILSALSNYVETSNYEAFKETLQAQLSVMADRIELNFAQTIESIENVNGDMQSRFETLSKYIRGTVDGIEIGINENTLKLTLDNDMICFSKNGLPVGWWDGTDFHTGNIVVEVNERAQFGNFAFVPRSDGGLMFLKVADTTETGG